MQIFGLMIVRNEVDILRINVLHHLFLGIDQILIVDNGSTDGTDQALQELAEDPRVEWRRDAGPYRQSEITTELAREAFRRGADWVIPIDADEFWYVPGGDFRGVLERSAAGALQIEVLNFIQSRNQAEATQEGLLSLTRRTPLPVGPLERVWKLVESREYAYVEMMYSPKFISRPAAEIQIAMGNHGVTGICGPVEATGDIICLHAVLRSRSVLEAKVEQGRRVAELGLPPEQGWHVQRWTRLAEEGGLEAEWKANSYAGGCLDVYGVVHPVVFDPRLRDVAARWVEEPEPDQGHLKDERAALLHTIQAEINAHQREARRLTDGVQDEINLRDGIISELQKELELKIGERDRTINELQAELHRKVGERDRVIGELQAEFQFAVGERDRSITDLQNELYQKVEERDRIIIGLQSELHQKVEERDCAIRTLQAKVIEQERIINDTQAELHSKVGECNAIITGLQTELHAKVGERDRIITGLQAELHQKAEEYDHTVADLSEREAEGKRLIRQLGERVTEQERVIRELRSELDAIQRSKLWPLIRALRTTRSGAEQ